MISGKGILYTVLAASSAALLVGTMLTPKRREPLRRFGNRVQDFIANVKEKTLAKTAHSRPETDTDQLSPSSPS